MASSSALFFWVAFSALPALATSSGVALGVGHAFLHSFSTIGKNSFEVVLFTCAVLLRLRIASGLSSFCRVLVLQPPLDMHWLSDMLDMDASRSGGGQEWRWAGGFSDLGCNSSVACTCKDRQHGKTWVEGRSEETPQCHMELYGSFIFFCIFFFSFQSLMFTEFSEILAWRSIPEF